jgi:hypothetical protein
MGCRIGNGEACDQCQRQFPAIVLVKLQFGQQVAERNAQKSSG